MSKVNWVRSRLVNDGEGGVIIKSPMTAMDKRELEALRGKLAQVKVLLYGHSLQVMKALFSKETLALIHISVLEEIPLILMGKNFKEFESTDPREVELVTASYLSHAQREVLEEVLLKKFGPISSIKEDEQSELVAGLTIKIGNIELDFSIFSKCQAFDESLIVQLA